MPSAASDGFGADASRRAGGECAAPNPPGAGGLRSEPGAAGRRAERREVVIDAAALVLLALSVGLPWYGHYAKPHTDFFEFAETGRSLLACELPRTLKRAPLYPLLVAGGGAALAPLGVFEAPELVAGQALALMGFAASPVLLYLLLRSYAGGAARWWAAAFVFLPVGVQCASYAIVEPVLVAASLGALLAVRRGGGWAYVLAAAAMLLRYDVAAMLAGVMLADRLGGAPSWRVLRRGATAAMPLAAWLALTAWTWSARSDDHYVAQMADRPEFEPRRALASATECLLPWRESRFPMPAFAAGVEPLVRVGLVRLLQGLALVGVVVLLRRGDRAAVAGSVAFAGYVAVHALFPFHFARFGLPLAGLVLFAAAAGGAAIHRAWQARFSGTSAARREALGSAPRVQDAAVGARLAAPGMGLAGVAGALTAGVVWALGAALVATLWLGLLLTLPWRPADATVTQLVGALLAMVGVGAVYAVGFGGAGVRGAVVAAGVAWFGVFQTRQLPALMGTGVEAVNSVHAARWIRDHADPSPRVLSSEPGVLRMFARGRGAGERFVGLEQIRAAGWSSIVAECRAQGIGYIVWHEHWRQQHGEFYADKWGVDRFDVLRSEATPAGVEIEREFTGTPRTLVLRVAPGDGAGRADAR
ncbi:MAG: hypothetical protein AB7Q17_02800 [Phycisphaerae bacterium]